MCCKVRVLEPPRTRREGPREEGTRGDPKQVMPTVGTFPRGTPSGESGEGTTSQCPLSAGARGVGTQEQSCAAGGRVRTRRPMGACRLCVSWGRRLNVSACALGEKEGGAGVSQPGTGGAKNWRRLDRTRMPRMGRRPRGCGHPLWQPRSEQKRREAAAPAGEGEPAAGPRAARNSGSCGAASTPEADQGSARFPCPALPRAGVWALPGLPSRRGLSRVPRHSCPWRGLRRWAPPPGIPGFTPDPATRLRAPEQLARSPGALRRAGTQASTPESEPGSPPNPGSAHLAPPAKFPRGATPAWSGTRALTVDSLSPAVEGDQRQK